MNEPPQNPRSLRRRMATASGIMIAGVLLMAAGGIIGIQRLHENLSVALVANGQLRQMYETGTQLELARHALGAAPPNAIAGKLEIESALRKLDPAFVSPNSPATPWLDETTRRRFQNELQAIANQLPAAPDNASASISDAIGQLGELSTQVRQTIQSSQTAADENQRDTLLVVGALAGIVIAVAAAAGLVQYRSVVKPLDKLSEGVRAFAGGALDRRIDAGGDASEFAALAADFNTMAAQLRALYSDLSEQVAVKSKQLVRSERLASVGYLAAGVSHEINNPLGIITGYGQRAITLLDRFKDSGSAISPEMLGRTRRALEVMCEEAFRCKGITDRLLSLARPGVAERSAISLKMLVCDVISAMAALPGAGKPVVLHADAADMFVAEACEGEIRQVLLNLLLNAQAATANGGDISVELKRLSNAVEMHVIDTGRGMDAATLDRIFEPFYTDRRDGAPGTGLGLSITNAIVASHGGSVAATSAGLGKGSRFVVTLPAPQPDSTSAQSAAMIDASVA